MGRTMAPSAPQAKCVAVAGARSHLLGRRKRAMEPPMFWIAIAVAVGIICLLTWIGAAMTRRGLPNRWERRDGMIPGPGGDDLFH